MTPMPRARTQLPMTAVIPLAESMVMTRLDTSKAAILMNGMASSLVTRTPVDDGVGHLVRPQDLVDALLGAGHQGDADPRLVQEGEILHEHGEQGIVQHRVVDPDDECRAAELLEVAEDLADGVHPVTVPRDILVLAGAFLLHDRRVLALAGGVNGRRRPGPMRSRTRARWRG